MEECTYCVGGWGRRRREDTGIPARVPLWPWSGFRGREKDGEKDLQRAELREVSDSFPKNNTHTGHEGIWSALVLCRPSCTLTLKKSLVRKTSKDVCRPVGGLTETVLATFVIALTKGLARSRPEKRRIYFSLQFERYSPPWSGRHGSGCDRLLVTLPKQVGPGHKTAGSPSSHLLLPANLHLSKVPQPSQAELSPEDRTFQHLSLWEKFHPETTVGPWTAATVNI